jgi:CubicO group peptidase (beta-lactamase class C family)
MTLQVTTTPADLGFSAERLDRIGARFARYVEDGLLPGWLVAVTRRGQLAYVETAGYRDVEAALPVEHDTLFRIFSMTKPVTSVAAMMLYEQGVFELLDPVSRWIPAFSDMRVYRGGPPQSPATVPATEPIRVWHLLTHTAGLTYGFLNADPVDAMYRAAGFDWTMPADLDLAGCVERVAELPLLFEPGSSWNYSVATDVLGRLVEIWSGRPLDEFFATEILGPLGMADTGFAVPDAERNRLATLYIPAPGTRTAVPIGRLGAVGSQPPAALSGGGGLVSTAPDYLRFCQLLAGGGERDGVRLLSPRTLAYMTRNHLPGGQDLAAFGRPIHAETPYRGVGFGLGFAVVSDAAAYKTLGSAGEFSWGGAASTAFFVDPAEEITAVFLTQLLPSTTHPIRTLLRQLVYQALTD